jgi:SAM-dependent methyltransferase
MLVEGKCIFCGKESDRVDWEENGFTGKRCDCGLLYVSPRPGMKEILSWYNSDEANTGARPRIRSEIWGRLNALHRLKILTRYKHLGNLLEIGPGSGYFLDESRRPGFNPFGIELNLRQSTFIKEKLRIPVEATPFRDSSFNGIFFDVICHFDVISHFFDPISEFKQFHDRLKKDGVLFFETGNGGDLSKKWLKFIGRLQYPHHLFLFSSRNVEQLCQDTGFKIIRVYRYSILFHLVAMKCFKYFKNIFLKKTGKMKVKKTTRGFRGEVKNDSMWKIFLLRIAIRGNLLIRYKIGKWLPKIGPQTVIYVAKKGSTIDVEQNN